MDAFLADRSPDAFARVVDRLLGSRHYGEKWGRHWLDLVRYADTSGCNSDFPVPEAYRYWFELNPLHALMQSWRSVFLQGALELHHVAHALAFAAVTGVVAWWLHRKLAPRIGELV